jgi:hypothetical protein
MKSFFDEDSFFRSDFPFQDFGDFHCGKREEIISKDCFLRKQ